MEGKNIAKIGQQTQQLAKTLRPSELILTATEKIELIVSGGGTKMRDLPADSVEKHVVATLLEFMAAYSPHHESTAPLALRAFARQVIAGYSHWVLADVENFLLWFVENQSNPEIKVVGNKITYLMLSAALPIYEEQRIDIIRHNKNIKAATEEHERADPTMASAVIEQIRKRLRKPYESRELTEEEKAAAAASSALFAEFDKIWAEQGEPRHGAARYVTVNGSNIYLADWEQERTFGKLKEYSHK